LKEHLAFVETLEKQNEEKKRTTSWLELFWGMNLCNITKQFLKDVLLFLQEAMQQSNHPPKKPQEMTKKEWILKRSQNQQRRQMRMT